jgi:myo-inositol-1-phosphate synthase
MEGTTFGDVPLNLEMKLEVWDSPNSAGVVIDAVRCAKLGLDHGLKGALVGPSSYFKKSPPWQFPDELAHGYTEQFIRDPKSDAVLKQQLRKAGVEPARYVSGAGAKAAKTSKMVEAAKPATKRAKPAKAPPAAKPKAGRKKK